MPTVTSETSETSARHPAEAPPAAPDAPASAPASASARVRSVLRATSGWRPVDFAELWQFRDLFWILAQRDVKVRYKQTALGAAWAVIQPLSQMILFTVVFKRVADLDTDGLPGPIFYFAGLLPWTLFSTGMNAGANSLVAAQNMIKKVYFPRLIVPVSATIVSVVDFAIAFCVMAVLMAVYLAAPPPQVLLLPLLVALAYLAALGLGLWLSALNVEYRDVRYVIPFLTQFLLFATPIMWSMTKVESAWAKVLVGLNPVAGVVVTFRWCLVGTPPQWLTLATSVGMIALLCASGLFYFRRTERSFADVV